MNAILSAFQVLGFTARLMLIIILWGALLVVGLVGGLCFGMSFVIVSSIRALSGRTEPSTSNVDSYPH